MKTWQIALIAGVVLWAMSKKKSAGGIPSSPRSFPDFPETLLPFGPSGSMPMAMALTVAPSEAIYTNRDEAHGSGYWSELRPGYWTWIAT